MRRLVALFALGLLVLVPQADSYPISPVPLWELVERAELIVLAEVGPTNSEPENDEHHWNRDVASLEVIEVWKGQARARSQLRVNYSKDLVCPAPPRYVAGAIVVAFLARDEDSEKLVTVGLSYGTLYPGPEAVDDFREQVLTAAALQKNGKVAQDDRLAWLVAAASRPATRWR